MKLLRKTFKWFLYFLLIPISYLIISLLLTFITINGVESASENKKEIFLSTNGVHLEIIMPINVLSIELKEDIDFTAADKYISFGWGDEKFYLNTPTWGDLTFKNAFTALFIKSSALIHLTRSKQVKKSWTKIIIGESELAKLNQYILKSFKKDENGGKIIIYNSGYSVSDDFYKANGKFSCFKTCNTWVNKAFKESDLKSCLWTPFDFGLINIYE
jgi:uncharacterized protein (TIGR02117 family)